MNKMVINHLEKLFVTSDASTIISELEVNHPAAKLVAMAAKAQEAEIGDGTNLVSGALLMRRAAPLALARGAPAPAVPRSARASLPAPALPQPARRATAA